MSSNSIASDPIGTVLAELRAFLDGVLDKLDNHSRITDVRLDELTAKMDSLEVSVRPKMDALEASVRIAQVGVPDISEFLNDAQEIIEGGKRRRLNSDPDFLHCRSTRIHENSCSSFISEARSEIE